MEKTNVLLDSFNEKEEKILALEKRMTSWKVETKDVVTKRWKEEEDVRVKAELRIAELEEELLKRGQLRRSLFTLKSRMSMT